MNVVTKACDAQSPEARPFFSIVIPTYNRSDLLRQTIESVRRQAFHDYEIIVSDDCSTDDTSEVIRSMTDDRIRYFRNDRNLGYSGNLRVGASYARGDVLYLLGHDDLLLADALERTFRAFQKDPGVGVVTRPYYWFERDPARPVRHVPSLDPSRDVIVDVRDGPRTVEALVRSSGQLSGLAYRLSDLRVGFHDDIFPCHVYPFADILRRSKAVFLKDYTVAVRIESSQLDTFQRSMRSRRRSRGLRCSRAFIRVRSGGMFGRQGSR